MQAEVIRLARAVKAWQRRDPARARLPVLWVFSDPARLPDPLATLARLPPGLCGLVLRDMPAAQAAVVARAARARRVAVVLAGAGAVEGARTGGGVAGYLGCGEHWRGGRRGSPGGGPGRLPSPRLRTASAHNRVELRRALLAGVDLVFLSPLRPTASHPGAAALGPLRWSALARCCKLPVAALGGVAGRALPAAAAGFGVIAPFDARAGGPLAGIGTGPMLPFRS